MSNKNDNGRVTFHNIANANGRATNGGRDRGSNDGRRNNSSHSRNNGNNGDGCNGGANNSNDDNKKKDGVTEETKGPDEACFDEMKSNQDEMCANCELTFDGPKMTTKTDSSLVKWLHTLCNVSSSFSNILVRAHF